jgi:uncharacterized protein (UPF0333 family)
MTFALVSQNESAYTYAQDNDIITENNSNLNASLKNMTIMDTKSKIQFSGLIDEKNSTVKTVRYTPKFLCGNVTSNEGPVRPGHYDTYISILNKQDFPIKILWNVIPGGGNSSNSIIKILQPESSTSIACRDILPLVTHSKNLLEGFVILSLPISGNRIGAFPDPDNPDASILRTIDDSQLNLIDVQVFYTANALPELPSEMIFSKIDFRILSDPSGKIPESFLRQALEVLLLSNTNQIYDQLFRIKSLLKERFNLSDSELSAINIQIEGSDIDAIFTNDDHAISSSRVSPNIYFR